MSNPQLDAPTQVSEAPARPKGSDELLISPGTNSDIGKMRLACGGDSTLPLMAGQDNRPRISEGDLTPAQREQAGAVARATDTLVKSLAEKYQGLQNLPKAELDNLNKVLDGGMGLKYSVKMDGFDDGGARVRCPFGNQTSVVFPPPAMDGNYRFKDGRLDIMTTKGGYVPFKDVVDRLQHPRSGI